MRSSLTLSRCNFSWPFLREKKSSELGGHSTSLVFSSAFSAVAVARAQVQQEPSAETTEGTGISINCSHPNIQIGDFILWYRQLPGRGPALLVRSAKESKDVPAPPGRLSVAADRRSSALWLARPRRGDAAVYYCAVGDTGRGAGAAAGHEQARAGPGVCVGGQPRPGPPGGAAAPPVGAAWPRTSGRLPRPTGTPGSEGQDPLSARGQCLWLWRWLTLTVGYQTRQCPSAPAPHSPGRSTQSGLGVTHWVKTFSCPSALLIHAFPSGRRQRSAATVALAGHISQREPWQCPAVPGKEQLQPPGPLAPGEEQRLSTLPKKRSLCPRAAGQPSVLPQGLVPAEMEHTGPLLKLLAYPTGIAKGTWSRCFPLLSKHRGLERQISNAKLSLEQPKGVSHFVTL